MSELAQTRRTSSKFRRCRRVFRFVCRASVAVRPRAAFTEAIVAVRIDQVVLRNGRLDRDYRAHVFAAFSSTMGLRPSSIDLSAEQSGRAASDDHDDRRATHVRKLERFDFLGASSSLETSMRNWMRGSRARPSIDRLRMRGPLASPFLNPAGPPRRRERNPDSRRRSAKGRCLRCGSRSSAVVHDITSCAPLVAARKTVACAPSLRPRSCSRSPLDRRRAPSGSRSPRLGARTTMRASIVGSTPSAPGSNYYDIEPRVESIASQRHSGGDVTPRGGAARQPFVVGPQGELPMANVHMSIRWSMQCVMALGLSLGVGLSLAAGCASTADGDRIVRYWGPGGSSGVGGKGGQGGTSPCGPGTMECAGTCVDTKLDPQNCGACAKTCAAGEVCSGGVCGLTCTGGSTLCSGTCVDTKLDGQNCGGCAKTCAAGQVCSGGSLRARLYRGMTSAARTASTPRCDPANCGGCAKACADRPGLLEGACGSLPGGTTPLRWRRARHDLRPRQLRRLRQGLRGRRGLLGRQSAASAPAARSSAAGAASSRGPIPRTAAPARRPAARQTRRRSSAGPPVARTSHEAGFGDCDGTNADGCEMNLGNDLNNCGHVRAGLQRRGVMLRAGACLAPRSCAAIDTASPASSRAACTRSTSTAPAPTLRSRSTAI